MNVGDYVRTRDGDIGKTFEKYKGVQGAIIYKIDRPTEDFDYTNVFDWEIIKTSPNIIDLIEVGDFVNGREIDYIGKEGVYSDYDNAEYYYFESEEIETVVTHEQFKNISYKVGE